MQPYRFADTESGAQGPRLCQHDGCDEAAEVQHRRHATDQEYAALPEGHVPIDGICHVAVFTCGDHELDPPCGPEDHPEAQTGLDPLRAQCPKCGAAANDPCVKPNGKLRRSIHAVRDPEPPYGPPQRCDHAHRADCEGLDACVCSAGDPIPERPAENGLR